MVDKCCQKCGAKVLAHLKFCTQCGWKFEAENLERQIEPEIQDTGCKEETWTCLSCGQDGNTKKFCKKCGSIVKENIASVTEMAVDSQKMLPNEITVNRKSDFSKNKYIGLLKKYKRQGVYASIIISLIIIVAVGCMNLWGNTFESQEKEYAKVAGDIKTQIVQLESLSGDKDDEKQKSVISNLEINGSKLEEICDNLEKDQTQDESKKLLALVKANKDAVSALVVLMNTEIHLGNNKQAADWKEYDVLVSNILKPYQNDNLKDISDIKINNVPLDSLINGEILKSAVAKYTENKQKNDADFIKRKLDMCNQKQQAINADLQKLKEVVFLVENVDRKNDKRLVIKGVFANGTGDNITSIKNMLVDVTLMKDGKEVLVIKDMPYSDSGLTNINLQAGKSTQREIEIAANMSELAFDEYKVDVHKIHWSIRKILRR